MILFSTYFSPLYLFYLIRLFGIHHIHYDFKLGVTAKQIVFSVLDSSATTRFVVSGPTPRSIYSILQYLLHNFKMKYITKFLHRKGEKSHFSICFANIFHIFLKITHEYGKLYYSVRFLGKSSIHIFC